MDPNSIGDIMQEGDTVLLENFVNVHIQETKFAQLKRGHSAKIAKANVPHEALFGHAYGTKFEVSKRDGKVTLIPVVEDENDNDLGEDEDSVDIDLQNDNRDLQDRNALTRGKESSQKLGASQIEELKQSGKGGKEVIQALIDNSETFKQKTEFSQAKWLKRKTAKHISTFRAVKCCSYSLCRAYFSKEAHRVCHLREDSLGRLLTMSNVQAGSRVLMVDSTNGLLIGAVAERMGGFGRIMNGYNGLQPSVDAVRWLNLSERHIQTIINFPLSELAFHISSKRTTSGDISQNIAEMGKEEANSAESAAPMPPVPEQDLPATSDTVNVESNGTPAVAAQSGAKMDAEASALRKKRVELGHKSSMSFRPDSEVRQPRPSPDEIQAELALGFDSLVVAGSLQPEQMMTRLFAPLKSSSPFVVYSPYAQPLLTVMEQLMKEECAVDMHITETWMREYQVLPGRTHPNMHMAAASGFLLTGTKAIKKVPRPDAVPPSAPADREGSATKRRKTEADAAS